MTDISRIIDQAPGMDASDREWLHHLVADWQVIADLGYFDLQFVVPVADGHFLYAGQCRPSTGLSVRPDDVVGHLASASIRPLLIRAMSSHDVFRSRHVRQQGDARICSVYAGIWHAGHALGVLIRQTDLKTREFTGRYERAGIAAAKVLFSMVTRGEFPYSTAVNSQLHNPRVSDGFLIVDKRGVLQASSPNALSCLRRMGLRSDPSDHVFAEVMSEILKGEDQQLERLKTVLTGMVPSDTTVDCNGASVTFRCLPLHDVEKPNGAVILLRDITELRLRDKELKTANATISEIHHRVKNNLQAVSSLLDLQARRSKNPEVKEALQQAQRRVQTIARVHEGLSRSADEMVDFDSVIHEVLAMTVEVERKPDQHIDLKYSGKFGRMLSQDATPLSLVLNELVSNSVEHGFAGQKKGTISVSVARWKNSLNITVEDDGNGLPSSAQKKSSAHSDSSSSGLGTQIINTFVQGDFGGTVHRISRPEGGTRVDLTVTLRAS